MGCAANTLDGIELRAHSKLFILGGYGFLWSGHRRYSAQPRQLPRKADVNDFEERLRLKEVTAHP